MHMAEKVSDYRILSATTHQELEAQVRELLSQQYRPHGGLRIIEIDRPDGGEHKKHFMFLQPVIRTE